MNDHYQWMFWCHEWKPRAVRTRMEPFLDPLTRKIPENVGSMKTDILYVCACGKVKVRSMRGPWTLQEVTV